MDLETYTEEEGSTSIRKPKSYNESTAFNGEDGLMDVNCKFSEGTLSFPDLPNLESGENPDSDYNQEISQKDLYLLVSDLNCIINDVMPNDSVGENLSGISGLPKDFRDETSSEYLDSHLLIVIFPMMRYQEVLSLIYLNPQVPMRDSISKSLVFLLTLFCLLILLTVQLRSSTTLQGTYYYSMRREHHFFAQKFWRKVPSYAFGRIVFKKMKMHIMVICLCA